MAKLCKERCIVDEADKFCREHGDLLKCKDGHEILAATGLCKEDSCPPKEPITSANSDYNADTGNMDIQMILRGLTSQLSEGMADSLVKALANNSSGNGKAPPEFVKDPKDLEQSLGRFWRLFEGKSGFSYSYEYSEGPQAQENHGNGAGEQGQE